jgi:hypothetical protein
MPLGGGGPIRRPFQKRHDGNTRLEETARRKRKDLTVRYPMIYESFHRAPMNDKRRQKTVKTYVID